MNLMQLIASSIALLVGGTIIYHSFHKDGEKKIDITDTKAVRGFTSRTGSVVSNVVNGIHFDQVTAKFGETCKANLPCEEGLKCGKQEPEDTEGKCYKDLGQSCTFEKADECFTGYCNPQGNMCFVPLPAGTFPQAGLREQCYIWNIQCKSGLECGKKPGDKIPVCYKKSGQSCSGPNDCFSGNCGPSGNCV